jgi:hypothetical protein
MIAPLLLAGLFVVIGITFLLIYFSVIPNIYLRKIFITLAAFFAIMRKHTTPVPRQTHGSMI